MKTKDYLTSQPFKDICKSKFELARYAIQIARHYIKAGQELDISDVLDEVRRHPDPIYLEELAKELDDNGKGAA